VTGGAHAGAPRSLQWVSAAYVGGVLLHIDRVPLWASAVAIALTAWRVLSARSGWYPGVITRALLALLLVALVLARFHTLNGLAAGTTLLVLMAGLKLLETRGTRDEFVMLGGALFDRQNLLRTPLYAAHAWLCCAALAVVAHPQLAPRAAARLAGRALLMALPLAALLFVLFPRLPGAFWSIPRGGEATTGLSDSMNPGSIVRLTANYEPALRARFLGAVPPPPERYWRCPVLHDFDGYTWRVGAGFRAHESLVDPRSVYRYRVTLQPSQRRWWIALDTPAQSPDPHVVMTFDHQLLADEPVTVPVTFEAMSYTHATAAALLDESGRFRDTLLPPAVNPRSVQFARSMRSRVASDADFVHAVLEFLRTGGFAYSLTPEQLGSNPVDDFLFNTRSGFCGHYASAFATLMRAAGVPARVVTGYLGGEWNPIGGYFIVHQSDAHAWTEVWLAGRGWTRVDPTAVVAPERLNRGVYDLLPDSQSTGERLLHSWAFLMQLEQRWDAANAWWNTRVLRFDDVAQLKLLERLGVRSPDILYLGWGFMAALCAWLALVSWRVGRSASSLRDPLARAYSQLCRKAGRVVGARLPYQGPLAFAAQVMAARPQLGALLQPLFEQYAQLRYGPENPGRQADVEAFRRAVRRLKLPAGSQHAPGAHAGAIFSWRRARAFRGS
jgi:transglutaminase-like putative cysteine protease